MYLGIPKYIHKNSLFYKYFKPEMLRIKNYFYVKTYTNYYYIKINFLPPDHLNGH